MAGGDCFTCKRMERILEVSLVFLDVFGLKSHKRVIFSQSWAPESVSRSAIHSFSAFLKQKQMLVESIERNVALKSYGKHAEKDNRQLT